MITTWNKRRKRMGQRPREDTNSYVERRGGKEKEEHMVGGHCKSNREMSCVLQP